MLPLLSLVQYSITQNSDNDVMSNRTVVTG